MNKLVTLINDFYKYILNKLFNEPNYSNSTAEFANIVTDSCENSFDKYEIECSFLNESESETNTSISTYTSTEKESETCGTEELNDTTSDHEDSEFFDELFIEDETSLMRKMRPKTKIRTYISNI